MKPPFGEYIFFFFTSILCKSMELAQSKLLANTYLVSRKIKVQTFVSGSQKAKWVKLRSITRVRRHTRNQKAIFLQFEHAGLGSTKVWRVSGWFGLMNPPTALGCRTKIKALHMQMQEKIIEKWQCHKQLFLEYHKESKHTWYWYIIIYRLLYIIWVHQEAVR